MDELERLQELYTYKLLDTAPEKELNELAELASLICEAPIALVSLVDDKRQWFKANVGFSEKETPREHAFCHYALAEPDEVLVVHDPDTDERFRDNPLVLNRPNIRFYAGAPLKTPDGYALGTLCVLDNKPRAFTEAQKTALQLIAKRAMGYLNNRKLLLERQNKIGSSVEKLKKLYDAAPGAVFQLEMAPEGTPRFHFISGGFNSLNAALSLDEVLGNAAAALAGVHPDDVEAVLSSLRQSYESLSTWSVEYRVVSDGGKEVWHWVNATPERKGDGTVMWYGTFQDITTKKEFTNVLEQIVYDISHVMRKPVANLLGLATAITDNNLDDAKLLKYTGYLKAAAEEMDTFIKALSTNYSKLLSDFALEADAATMSN